MSASGYVHLDPCSVLNVTDSAILVMYEGTKYWFPLTHVADPETYEAGDEEITISVTEWIARQKGTEVE